MKSIFKDSQERQRRENYHRAEAFLVWKLGMTGFREVNDLVRRGSRGEDTLNSLFVEFVERVEQDLLERVRIIEDQHFKAINLRFETQTMPCMFTKEDIERLQENTKRANEKDKKEATDGRKPEPSV